jgi:hypothetical protein
MRVPKNFNLEKDFEFPEFDFNPRRKLAPDTTPQQESIARPPPEATYAYGAKKSAPADPVPGNKKAKKKKRPRGDPVQALSLPFKAVGSISNILSSGKDNGKFLNNLFKQSTGLVDSYLCLCNAEDPESFRKIARSVIGGQIVQNVVIGEIVTKKLMDSIDDREKLAPWMELKHRNDQQVLAAVDAMAKLTSLPGGAGKPSVTLNVANMLTGEKQVSHLDVIPKENRNDY